MTRAFRKMDAEVMHVHMVTENTVTILRGTITNDGKAIVVNDYCIAGYFWKVFIFGYFKRACIFENKFPGLVVLWK